MFSFEGSLDVFFGHLGIRKLQFLIKNIQGADDKLGQFLSQDI